MTKTLQEVADSAPRARRVIRWARLSEYTGLRHSAIEEMVKRGLLHPFNITGQRAKVVYEDEVAALQEAAYAWAMATKD